MGLLSNSLLMGAAQGLSVIGNGMLKGVERDQEQAIWEKRQALLSAIQRENAKVGRQDQAAFDDERFPVKLDQAKQEVAARGEAQTAAEVARLNNPELQGAQDEAARRTTQREIDSLTQKLNDPGLTAAEQQKAQRELEQAKARIEALAPAEAKRAGMITSATAGAQARAQAEAEKTRVNPVLQKVQDYEEVTGTKLAPEIRKQLADAYIGLSKGDGAQLAKAVGSVLKKFEGGDLPAEQVGAELRTLIASLKSGTEQPTLEQAHADAAAAVAKGASKDAVNAELKKMGFAPLPEAPATQPTKTPKAKPAAPPEAQPQMTPEAQAAAIEARLAADDKLKAGGISGIGARMIQQGALPMAFGERRALEEQLARLRQGR